VRLENGSTDGVVAYYKKGYPNNSTAHRFTSIDDGLRIPASDEYIEGSHEVPLLDVRLENGSTDGVVAYYKEGYPKKSTAHRVTSIDDGLRIPASDGYIEGGHDVPLLDIFPELEYIDDDDDEEEEEEKEKEKEEKEYKEEKEKEENEKDEKEIYKNIPI
jgi:hypothetical protein